jgi:hypothetical protein
MARRPADPEEELRWMSQEVRGYVEAVLNSLGANVPKVFLFLECQSSYYFQLLIKFFEVLIIPFLLNRQLFFAKWRKPKKTCLINYIVLLGWCTVIRLCNV